MHYLKSSTLFEKKNNISILQQIIQQTQLNQTDSWVIDQNIMQFLHMHLPWHFQRSALKHKYTVCVINIIKIIKTHL